MRRDWAEVSVLHFMNMKFRDRQITLTAKTRRLLKMGKPFLVESTLSVKPAQQLLNSFLREETEKEIWSSRSEHRISQIKVQ